MPVAGRSARISIGCAANIWHRKAKTGALPTEIYALHMVALLAKVPLQIKNHPARIGGCLDKYLRVRQLGDAIFGGSV